VRARGAALEEEEEEEEEIGEGRRGEIWLLVPINIVQ